jgi:hypothetical protein
MIGLPEVKKNTDPAGCEVGVGSAFFLRAKDIPVLRRWQDYSTGSDPALIRAP